MAMREGVAVDVEKQRAERRGPRGTAAEGGDAAPASKRAAASQKRKADVRRRLSISLTKASSFSGRRRTRKMNLLLTSIPLKELQDILSELDKEVTTDAPSPMPTLKSVKSCGGAAAPSADTQRSTKISKGVYHRKRQAKNEKVVVVKEGTSVSESVSTPFSPFSMTFASNEEENAFTLHFSPRVEGVRVEPPGLAHSSGPPSPSCFLGGYSVSTVQVVFVNQENSLSFVTAWSASQPDQSVVYERLRSAQMNANAVARAPFFESCLKEAVVANSSDVDGFGCFAPAPSGANGAAYAHVPSFCEDRHIDGRVDSDYLVEMFDECDSFVAGPDSFVAGPIDSEYLIRD